MTENHSMVSIGMPVYNGEKHLRQSIESILSQTHSDFELIISDNASTDSTHYICKEYAQKDKRIQYFHHKENRGMSWNFNFVLNESKYDYFMWAASDDIHSSSFVEKNLEELLCKNNIVCSMSKIKFHGINTQNSKSERADPYFRRFRQKIRFLRPRKILSIKGSFNEKVKCFLRKSSPMIIFGLFRTDVLKKSIPKENFYGRELAILLNVIRYGDVSIVDEELFTLFQAGASKRGYLNLIKLLNQDGVIGMIFPYFSYTNWCIRHLGAKNFLSNLDSFFITNTWSLFLQILDIMRIVTNKISSK